MTWKEFKDATERSGVLDTDKLVYATEPNGDTTFSISRNRGPLVAWMKIPEETR